MPVHHQLFQAGKAGLTPLYAHRRSLALLVCDAGDAGGTDGGRGAKMGGIRRGLRQALGKGLPLGLLGGVVGNIQDVFRFIGTVFTVAVVLRAEAVQWPSAVSGE